jgi:diacylglycerol O-acyltransferase
MVVVDLPLGFEDPIEAFAACRASMNEVKASSQAEGVDLVAELGEWSTPMVTRMAIQATYTRVPANVIVTNIPGPRMPLYLLGARLEAAYPQVPLFGNHGLGLALFSYAGILHWGFNGDWDLVPELHDLVLAFDDAFATLKAAASS